MNLTAIASQFSASPGGEGDPAMIPISFASKYEFRLSNCRHFVITMDPFALTLSWRVE